MGSLRVLMPSNANTDSFVAKTNPSMANEELIIRRPGVPVTSIQTDWMCKRISHFTVSREVSLIGFGLYNNVNTDCYYGYNGEQINVEITIVEFKTGKTVYKCMSALAPTNRTGIQRVLFKKPVVLKPGRLYEAMAYYDQFVPLYLKTDPFQSVQSIESTHCSGTDKQLTIGFRQMLPKGRYQADCYPSEIPELIFE